MRSAKISRRLSKIVFSLLVFIEEASFEATNMRFEVCVLIKDRNKR